MGTTTTDLINSVKLKGSFPTSNDLFSSADYLNILNDELLIQIVPLLNKLNEEYFLTYKDYSIVADQDKYRIPTRAVGSSLRDVQLIDSNGSVRSLIRLFEEDKRSLTSGPQGYYVKGNQIILSPKPITTDGSILRLVYFRRPSKFVLTSACAQILSIDTATNTVVVSSLPSTITMTTPVDFVQAESPYDILEMDFVATAISGTTITFGSTLPDDLAVNDYITLAGQSCVTMIPDDLIPILVQAALCSCLTSKKDTQAKIELEKLEQMKSVMSTMLSPRVKSDDLKIKSGVLLNYFKR